MSRYTIEYSRERGPQGASGSTDASAITSGTLNAARLPATVVQTTGTYANPAWITELASTKITGTLTKAQQHAQTAYLDATSQVFAGAATFNGLLQINGAAGGASTYLQLLNNSGAIGILGSDASISGGNAADVGLSVYGDNEFCLWTNSTRMVRVTDSGSTFNGTATFNGNVQVNADNIYGKSLLLTDSIRLASTLAAWSPGHLYAKDYDLVVAGHLGISFRINTGNVYGGTEVARISDTGAATFNGNATIAGNGNRLTVETGSLHVGHGTTYPASANATYGTSIGFDGNLEHGWIQAVRFNVGEIRALELQPLGGNVMIGTTTEQSTKFHVEGTSKFTADATFQGITSIGSLDIYRVGRFRTATGGDIDFGLLGGSTIGMQSLDSGGNFQTLRLQPNGGSLSVGGAATFNNLVTATGFGVGIAADASIPFRALASSNTTVGMLLNNTSTGSSASSVVIVQSDAGQAGFRQYSAAHSVWPGWTVISSPSGGNGLALITSGTGNPIDFHTDNTLRATISDTGMTVNGTGKLGDYTVGTLPSASANAGHECNVTDSSVTTFGSTVAGGGSSRVKLYSNGTNWTVAGI